MYEKQIAAGIALLNAHCGSTDWVENIHLSQLDMGDPSRCVLGQLFGRFSKGRAALDVGYDNDSTYSVFDCGFDTTSDYDQLTEEWQEAIGKMIVDLYG